MLTKIDIKELEQYFDFDIDYLLCSASFEERCCVVAENINIKRVKSSVLFYNINNIDTYKGLEKRLRDRLSYTNCDEIQLDSEDPVENTYSIIKWLGTIENITEKIFAIDITTFTHETLLILYRLLNSKQIEGNKIFYLYNNALDYSINEPELEKKWLSVGNKEIRSIIGYSGFLSPLKKNLLMVLVGFEPERTLKLIDSYEPSWVSLGVGSNHCCDSESVMQMNKDRHANIANSISNVTSFTFSVTDPNATKTTLLKEVLKYPDFNIIIAPMNNKISSLGAALLAIEIPDIQLCYVPAVYYNVDGYSSPGSQCYIFQLND